MAQFNLKPEHKKTTNRATMNPNTVTNSQAPSQALWVIHKCKVVQIYEQTYILLVWYNWIVERAVKSNITMIFRSQNLLNLTFRGIRAI